MSFPDPTLTDAFRRMLPQALRIAREVFAVQQNGTVVSRDESILNFQGAGVTVTDDAASRRTNINIPGNPITTTNQTIVTFTSTARVLDLWNGSTNNVEPTNWNQPGFSDASWSLPNAGGNYVGVTADDGVHGAVPVLLTGGSLKKFLQRQSAVLPSGTITAATVSYAFDSVNSGAAVWINGTAVTGTGLHDATGVAVSPSLLTAGATNLIACECGNNSGANADIGARVRLAITYASSSVSLGYANIQEQQNNSLDAGTFTAGAWRTRGLNAIAYDPSSLVSLSASQITLPAGTYRIRAIAPGFAVDQHRARLQNVTDGITLLSGSNAYANHTNSGFSLSIIGGVFPIAASKALEVQHRCQTSESNNGFGPGLNFGDAEVYSVVEIWKLA